MAARLDPTRVKVIARRLQVIPPAPSVTIASSVQIEPPDRRGDPEVIRRRDLSECSATSPIAPTRSTVGLVINATANIDQQVQ